MNALLDDTKWELDNEKSVDGPMRQLIEDLNMNRKKSHETVWRNSIEGNIRRHPVYPLLLEDPMVRHSTVQPRGYPGDAELIDYIYGSDNIRPAIDAASSLGRRLNQFNVMTPAASAVRSRLRLAATEIDRLAATGSRPHILSIACGHLREAQYLESLPKGQLGRFVGVDQDPVSLALVRRESQHYGVEAIQCDARMLLRFGLSKLGTFDFIYSLGLYDYLSDNAARRLLTTAVNMLNRGGKVWIANFVEDISSAGYMEAVMDWWLTYRSEDRLRSLAEAIDPGKIATCSTFVEPEGNVALLEIVRA